MLIVFDIDGTIANIEHRLHHVRTKPKNWGEFDKGIPNDTPIKQTVEILECLEDNWHTILLVSGRNERSREATEAWLKKFYVPYEKLYMRKADDYRSDDIVKQEILDQIIIDYDKKPDMVFDDRPRVVSMWRKNGIYVLDVNQSGEDF